jgi:hypothetical protein
MSAPDVPVLTDAERQEPVLLPEQEYLLQVPVFQLPVQRMPQVMQQVLYEQPAPYGFPVPYAFPVLYG